MTIAKKIGRSAKPAAWRGSKPVKKPFLRKLKKGIIEKIASKFVGITRRKYYGTFQMIFGHQEAPLGGFPP